MQLPAISQQAPPPIPTYSKEKLELILAADPEMQTNKDLINKLLTQLCPAMVSTPLAGYVAPAPKGVTTQQTLEQESIEAMKLKAELEANAQQKIK